MGEPSAADLELYYKHKLVRKVLGFEEEIPLNFAKKYKNGKVI
jgi:hypothetical protein